jgi:cystathionine gamma-synthase
LDALARLVAAGEVSAVFTEFPSNPLLSVPDLKTLSDIVRPAGVPLVVDETLASFRNVDVASYADVIVTSLSKFYSGSATVMGGSLIVSEQSPLKELLKQRLEKRYVNELYAGDLAVLAEQGGERFITRMDAINRNAAIVVDFLENHPMVAKVYYPTLAEGAEHYSAVQKPGAGFGGLVSFELVDPELTIDAFFKALKVSGGPTLGTEFTIASLYTLLAHYDELAQVEQYGVSRHLVRMSIGSIEDPADVCRSIEVALGAAKNCI